VAKKERKELIIMITLNGPINVFTAEITLAFSSLVE